MNHDAKRPCPICEARFVEVLHHQMFIAPRELHVPGSYDVVACGRCGFVYADQATSQQDLDRDYASHSKYAVNVSEADSAADERGATDAPWDAARLADVAEYLSERVERSARVLDAGCSSGTFLRLLTERGFGDVVGLDPSRDAVARAERRNHIRAYVGSFTAPPSDLGTFDVVTLSHTLEHITDVREAVDSLRRLLAIGGLAYIEVPDAEKYDRYVVAPYHDFNTEHINHFSLRTLGNLMRSGGFEEIDSGAKIVRCSERDDYPAIFGLWRKVDRASDIGTFDERDEALVAAAKRYVEASRVRMGRIDDDLRSALAGVQDVIVWGAGQLSMKLLADTVLSTKRLAAIVDSSSQRHGMHVGPVSIVAPDAVRTIPAYPIVIASIHSDDAIARTIERTMELPNTVVRLYRSAAPAS